MPPEGGERNRNGIEAAARRKIQIALERKVPVGDVHENRLRRWPKQKKKWTQSIPSLISDTIIQLSRCGIISLLRFFFRLPTPLEVLAPNLSRWQVPSACLRYTKSICVKLKTSNQFLASPAGSTLLAWFRSVELWIAIGSHVSVRKRDSDESPSSIKMSACTRSRFFQGCSLAKFRLSKTLENGFCGDLRST